MCPYGKSKKIRLRESRIAGTRNLVATLGALSVKPRVLVSASAVGYYGDRGEESLLEAAAPSAGFLGRVCEEWEAAPPSPRRQGSAWSACASASS